MMAMEDTHAIVVLVMRVFSVRQRLMNVTQTHARMEAHAL